MYKIGYFSTSQQTIYGKTSKGATIYKINIFNDNNNCLLSYNGKLKGKIIIKFKMLNETKGIIVDVIGLMNDDNLLITLQYIYNIFHKSLYYKNLIINEYENNINRVNINNFIFSIDPSNCNDIDDALSLEITDNHYIVSVYIAQQIIYLNLDIIKDYIDKIFSTLYNEPYQQNKNLWGDLITNNSSLNMNELKSAYVIIFYINKLNNKFDKIEDYPVTIINSLKTNYEECLKYDIINKLYDITNNIETINNTHEFVSYWMVKVNNYIGIKYKYLNLPYRVIKKNTSIILDNIKIIDSDIRNIFINKISDSAYYSLTENYHAILDKFNYIHMTSPIRRLIDTINHWCFTYNINFNSLDINLDNINKLDKITKKYHNNIKLLNYINTLDENKIYYTDGWIYKNNWKEYLINNKSIKITVYFKDIGFQKITLLHKKFNYLMNEDTFDDIKVGNKYIFEIMKKDGFLPNEKLFIKLNNLSYDIN